MPDSRLTRVSASILALALVTGAIFLLREAVPVLSLGTLYLFAVLPVAAAFGLAYAIPVAVASMLVFNFFFLPPRHSFTLAERANWLVLVVYLTVAVVVSELSARARRRAAEAEQREREETLLAELSIALLQGERPTEQLPRVAEGVARVLRVDGARISLDPAALPRSAESSLALVAGGRRVGAVLVARDAALDPSICSRFLPALASLLAMALDRAAHERQAEETERLRVSDAVKTTILRAVGHDLRSPLTAVRVAAESLASPSVDLTAEEKALQLETVRTEAKRLDRLISNLLDLSRLEAGAAEPHRRLIALDDLVAQALAELEGDESAFQVDAVAEAPLVEVDPVHIERALVNVLENGSRFSPPDNPVVVQISYSDGEGVVRVSDRGPGIEKQDLERVFEPFASARVGEGGRGRGLGLSIARGFVEASGGRIWAEDGNGMGTTFVVTFPLARPLGAAP